MNKARRRELKVLHYKRRIRKIPLLKRAGERSYHAYLSHSTPCSCWCCRGEKYNRARVKEEARVLADPVCEVVISKSGIIRQSPYIPYIEGDEEEEEKMMEIWRECNFED